MLEIKITTNDPSKILQQLCTYFKGTLEEQWGEDYLFFDQPLGKGSIRSIVFDWGISLMDFELYFEDEVRLTFLNETNAPIRFIFITEGSLSYFNDTEDAPIILDRYQNIIIHVQAKEKETFVIPARTFTKINCISIIKEKYIHKKNNVIPYLEEKLHTVFTSVTETRYVHFGGYNLKIADQIQALRNSCGVDNIHALFIEGQLNIILALQLLEHRNYENKEMLLDSLNKSELHRIHELSSYILTHISEPITVSRLAKVAGMSPKKLQLGFKLLYAKSVHEHVKQLKLEIARDQIKNTEDTISEIVYAVGLKSRSYFSKIFFEQYGILPTTYRKKIKNRSI